MANDTERCGCPESRTLRRQLAEASRLVPTGREPDPERIAEWRRLTDAATRGPWRKQPEPGPSILYGVLGPQANRLGGVASLMFGADAAFVVAAREAMPVLLAALAPGQSGRSDEKGGG